jgi:tRNA(Ile)-lysidine synthetase-like protein
MECLERKPNFSQEWYIDNQPLHEWWLKHKDIWFSKTTLNREQFSLEPSKNENTAKINWILFYDQILRHPIENLDDFDRQSAFEFQNEFIVHLAKYTLPFTSKPEYQVFLMLCVRHQSNLDEKVWALEEIKKRILYCYEIKVPIPSIYFRFLRATLEDIEEFKVSNGLILYRRRHPRENIEFNQILENGTLPEVLPRPTIDKFGPLDTDKNQECITLSISGGVDSMILSYVMTEYARLKNIPVNLVHIQYNNRNTCRQEVEFLKKWVLLLRKNYYRVELWVRSIHEIHRHSIWRDIYEDITRTYRFNAYRQLGTSVYLGHNRNDVLENILTNICSGTHYDNLKGMKSIGSENGIEIIRPFLHIGKNKLMEMAYLYEIPYLEDSTPSWSRRGRIRDKVIPTLSSFDRNMLNGLEQLAEQMTNYRREYGEMKQTWIEQNCEFIRDGIVQYRTKKRYQEDRVSCLKIPTSSVYTYNEWKEFWNYMSNMIYVKNKPSNKSWNDAVKRIDTQNYIPLNDHVFIIKTDIYYKLCIL